MVAVVFLKRLGRLLLAAFKPGLLVGVALSLCVGLLFHYAAVRTIENENEERFRNMARAAQYTINARIKSYTNVLRAAASFFHADSNVSREKFQRYVSTLNLSTHYPAIETLNYMPWITDAERDAFEARIRSEFKEMLDDGEPFHIRPAGRRPAYSVLLYVEPEERWPNAAGLDLLVQPVMAKSLLDSRDENKLATSGRPVQVMKNRNVLGLAMRLPVYRAGARIDTVEQRRAAYIGSVGLAFSVAHLVQGVLDELPLKRVRLSLFNRVETMTPDVPRPLQLIYDSETAQVDRRPDMMAADPTRFHVWLPVDFNGRKWEAHFSTPKEAVERGSDTSFPLLALVAGFTTTMLLYGLFHTLTSSRSRAVELARAMTKELRESQEQLLSSHKKLQRLAAHAEHIKERERKRIAREIHDELGQNLMVLRIDAQLLSTRTVERHPRLHARAEATLKQIDTTIKSVRQIINDLRPVVLDLGLNAAVDWQIAEFQRRTGIKCDLVEHDREIEVDDHCATALFRILQESLTNVRRHALATWVRVDLRVEDNWVRMSVRDNGIGIKLREHKSGTFGLLGIEERVKMLGGTAALCDAPGGGTIVEVALPASQEFPHGSQHSYELEEDRQGLTETA